MKKFYTLFLTALLAGSAAWAADPVNVTVTMNTRATQFELVPLENQSVPEVSPAGTRKFEFQAVPDTKYKLIALDSNKKNAGSIVLTFDPDNTAISIFNPSVVVKNTGWAAVTDYDISVSLSDKSGASRVIEASTELGNLTFPAVSGDTYSVIVNPSETRATEGYLPYFASEPLTFNKTINCTCPMGYEYALTVPKGAKTGVYSKIRHFLPFNEIEPASVKDNGNNTETYTYTLGEKTAYSYRVKYADCTTVAEKFTMTAARTEKEITLETLQGIDGPKTVIEDPTANGGYNVSDIFLNADHRGTMQLTAGQTQQIVSLRNWEIVDGITSNYFIEPDYHFTVVGLDGKPASDVISVDEKGVITAKAAGHAIVLVTYDALYAPNQLGGPLFGAIEPQNTGVIVVSVDTHASSLKPNTTINTGLNADLIANRTAGTNLDAELDVLYFLNDAATYTFAPEDVAEVLVASPSFTDGTAAYSGFKSEGVTKNDDGTYTLTLPAGRNIVMLKGTDGKDAFQVIRARKLSYTVTNTTTEGAEAVPGDVLSVLIDGIYHPCNKLAGVYNMSATTQLSLSDGTTAKSKANQYMFASNAAGRTISVTIPADWDTEKDFTVTGGAIMCGGFGNPYGGHRDITYTAGKNPNFTALQHKAYFGSLPELVLYKGVTDIPDENLVILDFEDESFKGDVSNMNYVTSTMTASNYWSSLIDDKQYEGSLLYPSEVPDVLYGWYDEDNTNLRSTLNEGYGDGKFWNGGTAISNYVNTTYANADHTTQLEAYNPDGGKGGFGGSENFLVAYGYNDNSNYGSDSRPVLAFNGSDGEPVYAYVNLGTYGLRSAIIGDSYNQAATDADWVDITAEGLDANDQPISGSTARIRVLDGKNATSTWTKWDLSPLGKCRKIRFNFESTLVGDYGLNFPAYFLMDNIAVKKGSGSSGIEDVTAESAARQEQDSAIYDLTGRRLQRISAPGIYIVGGRKVMVK